MSPRSLAKRCALMLAIFLLLYGACETPEHKEERIARMYCGYCHAFPDPSLLDRATWDKSILPMMEFHMGATSSLMVTKIHPEDLDYVLSALPSRPMATAEDWQLIRKYYLKNSPDSIYMVHPDITDTLTLFEATPLKDTFEPYVTFVTYDSARQSLYVGTRLMDLFTFDSSHERIDALKLNGPPSWAIREKNEFIVSNMGIMDPNDRPAGSVMRITTGKEQITMIDSIKRPVYFEQHDLNGDGRDDQIVCAFGNYTGSLSVYEATPGDWIEHTLSATPGARRTVVRDINADGKPDILALFAQGNERIMLYTNRGDFRFDETLLMQFSPVDGTSYFEVVDFNNDGNFDLLVTNGDNADYSMIVKPYHGVTIYENDGNNKFTRKWSFPMPGASMAMAQDFDTDGDLDIAAISFFPDYERAPDRGFLYFENQGDYNFRPYKAPATTVGRWLVMEAADYDNDGDVDIVLGANNFRGLGAAQDDYDYWMENKTALLFLENGGKD